MNFLFYDYITSFANFSLDFPRKYYLNLGINPKHDYNTWSASDVQNNNIIFVKTNLIDNFFIYLFPNINTSFFLISGVAGLDVDVKYKKYLNENKIIRWIGTNIVWKHPKVFKIPIGFEEIERCINGTASYNGAHEGGDQNTLLSAYNSKKTFKDKNNAVLLTYIGNTHPKRKEFLSMIQNKNFIERADKLKFHDYIKKLNDYKFVLCPRGKGTDTHRFWEILLVGSVPIVEKNGLSDLYSQFPCIILNSFNDLSFNDIKNFKIDKNKARNIDKFLKLKLFTNNLNNLISFNSI